MNMPIATNKSSVASTAARALTKKTGNCGGVRVGVSLFSLWFLNRGEPGKHEVVGELSVINQ